MRKEGGGLKLPLEMPSKVTDRAVLSNGVGIPWLGLGTFKVPEGSVEAAVKRALKVGYRHIDTAAYYLNERGVGRALRESGVPRGEVFVTTKVWNSDQGYESTLKAFEASLGLLGTDYVDLYLVHWPVVGKYLETWRALEEIYSEGRVRAIGVSNFMEHHLRDLLGHCTIRPMVDQVEMHPWLFQPELLALCEREDIVVEAWSPLIRGRCVDIPELVEIGKGHGKTAAQVALRWDIQHGVVTIPKSVHPRRIEENADIFDFSLTEGEMGVIDSLDRHHRIGPDPDRVDF
jgi:diketogulonate reductase-like aldo/keto reductase